MPWAVRKGGGRCTSKQWAVINKDNGRTMGCHSTQAKAKKQLAAINANYEAVTTLRESVKLLLEAERRDRKPKDLNRIYLRVEKAFQTGWGKQKRAFLREFKSMRRYFQEAAVPERRINRAWSRAEKVGAAGMIRAIDRDAKTALARGGRSATLDLAAAEYGISFDIKHPEAVRYLERLGARRVAGINETTRARLGNLLAKAAKEGQSWTATARQIEALFDGFSQPGAARGVAHLVSRAELVAVTEMGQAYEQGRRVVIDEFKAQGINVEKKWEDVYDQRVCPECESSAADGWIPEGETFSGGLSEPLGHPACRCDMSVRVAERVRG